MKITNAFIVVILLHYAYCAVEFSHSTLYSIYDFEGVEEIPLPRCDNGCLIFASTLGTYYGTDDGLEPYMKNLVIYDSVKDRNQSIAELAVLFADITLQKVPLTISPGYKISILNLNDATDKGTDVTVWVVDRATATSTNYEIYDAVNGKRPAGIPANTITFMSADSFIVNADKGEKNSYSARLVGFDNAFDTNDDECRMAFNTLEDSDFEGFNFQVNSPLISFVFAKKLRVNVQADFGYFPNFDMVPGFITTPGFNGCKRLGGDAVHRQKTYHYSETIMIQGAPNTYRVDFDVFMNISAAHPITIMDVTNQQPRTIGGPLSESLVTIAKTSDVDVVYNSIKPPESFLMRINPTLIAVPTTAQVVTSPTTVRVTLPMTTSTLTPTTSASSSLGGLLTITVLLVLSFISST